MKYLTGYLSILQLDSTTFVVLRIVDHILYIYARWTMVYQIFRVGVLIPLFLDYGRKGLRQPQKQYHCRLILSNCTFLIMAISSVVMEVLYPEDWYFVFLAILPSFFTTILLICGVKMIGKEITRIGLQKHYKSSGLINMFTWSWTIDLVASTFAVFIVLGVKKFGL